MRRTAGIARSGVFAILSLGTIATACASTTPPTTASLTTATHNYWTDLALRTTGSVADAYGYLDASEKAHCPESVWQKAANNTNRFSTVEVSGAHVTSNDGSALVTVTYLVVNFMARDPDLPTATFATHWRWEGSGWHIESPVTCTTTG